MEVQPTLNLCKSVVTHEDFTSESEDDLKSFSEPESVVNVHRICRKVYSIFVPSTTLILTFDKPLLPAHIHCGYFNLRVRQYVPNSLRCFKCQTFGYTQEHCISQAICVSCGENTHSPPCKSSCHCVNCNGPHSSYSRDCPKFQIEREIQKFRATAKVSFPEARRCYQAQHPVDFSWSFVSVPKSTNSTSSSSQTTWPTRCTVQAHNLLK